MQYSAPATLITPSGTVLFNQTYGNGDFFFVTSIDGLDGEPSRAPVDEKAQTDGGILHDFYAGARHITVVGLVLPGNGTVAQRNVMERTLRLACRSLKLNGDEGTWEWLPDGDSTRSLVVKCDVQPTFPGDGVVKQLIFGLVAADPFYD